MKMLPAEAKLQRARHKYQNWEENKKMSEKILSVLLTKNASIDQVK